MKVSDIAVAHELAEQMNYEMFGGDPQDNLSGGSRPEEFNLARAAITALGLSAEEVAERLCVMMHEIVEKHIYSKEGQGDG